MAGEKDCMLMTFSCRRECEVWVRRMLQHPGREVITVQYQHSMATEGIMREEIFSALVVFIDDYSRNSRDVQNCKED